MPAPSDSSRTLHVALAGAPVAPKRWSVRLLARRVVAATATRRIAGLAGCIFEVIRHYVLGFTWASGAEPKHPCCHWVCGWTLYGVNARGGPAPTSSRVLVRNF